ncbi:metal-dependent hydrolase [Methanoculleus chikugoensis]|uniref:metal-dependent hydrolase n=1 Tax=Methanoculleus chikugoensis TaxID=118126 RepID=UPI0006D1C782|nr:metal-dependent hydrolase [Methanoculleus chikugoensis]
MYLLAHAMVGLLIGVVLAAIAGDRRVLALAVLGAVLPPDLIDKPLGHILLAGTVGYGRIYFHGLTILFLVVIAGLILYYYRRRIDLFAVAAGMASHQSSTRCGGTRSSGSGRSSVLSRATATRKITSGNRFSGSSPSRASGSSSS